MEYEEWEDEQYDLLISDNGLYTGPLSGKVIKVKDYRGIAFYVDGYTTLRLECIQCHMIGDDRVFTFDPDDYGITVMEDDEFCSTCGQIGCGWGVH
jgi:hypothetical protein